MFGQWYEDRSERPLHFCPERYMHTNATETPTSSLQQKHQNTSLQQKRPIAHRPPLHVLQAQSGKYNRNRVARFLLQKLKHFRAVSVVNAADRTKVNRAKNAPVQLVVAPRLTPSTSEWEERGSRRRYQEKPRSTVTKISIQA